MPQKKSSVALTKEFKEKYYTPLGRYTARPSPTALSREARIELEHASHCPLTCSELKYEGYPFNKESVRTQKFNLEKEHDRVSKDGTFTELLDVVRRKACVKKVELECLPIEARRMRERPRRTKL